MTKRDKISFQDLFVGGRYRHQNGRSIRQIDAIEGNLVSWHDQAGHGRCTKAVFVRKCLGLADAHHKSPPDAPPGRKTAGTPPTKLTARMEADALTDYVLATLSSVPQDSHCGEKGSGSGQLSHEQIRGLRQDVSARLERALKLKRHAPFEYETLLREHLVAPTLVPKTKSLPKPALQPARHRKDWEFGMLA